MCPTALVGIKTKVEPTSVKGARLDPNWIHTMNKEISALERNNTWELVPPKAGQNVVGCKQVFWLKEDGTVECYKDRLFAKGCQQREGYDFDVTYGHVAKAAMIRTMLLIAVYW